MRLLLDSKDTLFETFELNAGLSRAVLQGDTDLVELLLASGADVNYLERDVIPPIHAAVFAGNAVILQMLIDHGANLETPNRGGYLPLMEAVKRNDKAIVEILLQAGAEVKASVCLGADVTTARDLAIDADFRRLRVLLEKFRALEHLTPFTSYSFA